MLAIKPHVCQGARPSRAQAAAVQRRGITLAAGQAQPLVRHGSVAQRGRWAGRVQAAEDGPDELANLPEPDTARGAIALGLKLTDAKQWERAQQYFERALELPGTGTKRFRDKPPGISNGEKVSILYNIACCQSQLGEADNIQNGLIALAGCLEAGYDDFRQMRSDPDLANLRKSDKFDGLIKRFDRGGSFLGLF